MAEERVVFPASPFPQLVHLTRQTHATKQVEIALDAARQETAQALASLLIGLRENRLALLGNLLDDLPLGVVERHKRPSLGQVQRHLEQLPVTGRKHGRHRQVQGESQAQGRLVDFVETARRRSCSIFRFSPFGHCWWAIAFNAMMPIPAFFARL